MLIYDYFSAVLILRAELLKLVRLHPESEIIRKDRIIILQNSSYFTMIFTFEVKMYRLTFRNIVFRSEIFELADAEMLRNRLNLEKDWNVTN